MRNEIKKILFNQDRNKKRIEQLEKKYYSIQSIRYDKDKVKTNKINRETENKVISLLSDKEYQDLISKVEAVERVENKLDARQQIVYEEYYRNKKLVKWIANNKPVSQATIYREIVMIITLLEEELEIIGYFDKD